MLNFSVKAYYEDDPEVRDEVRKRVEPYTTITTNTTLPPIDPKDFKEGLDLEKMYKYMYLASEGYLWQLSQRGNVDIDQVVNDYKDMIEFWKELFLK